MQTMESTLAENQALKARVGELDLLVAQLKVQIAWLNRKTYGVGKSEAADHTQLMLELGKLEAQLAALEAPKKKLDECRPVVVRAKRALPSEVFAKLPVAEVETIIPEEVKAEPGAYRQIGVEVTTILDIIAPKLIKKEIHRLKFQRLDDKALAPVVAAVPVRMVPGGYASAGLIAYIVIQKYLRHLPLYRIEQMSVEWGAQLPRQSMVDWVRMAAEWTEVIYNRMLKELKEGNYIQLDETPIQYCDPDAGSGKTGLGYLWAVSHPQGDVVFDWRLSRRHGELTALIGPDYKGLMQSDGYGAYEAYDRTHPEVTWLGCWAHARRGFIKAQGENPRLVQAILKLIGRMYRSEADWTQKSVSVVERAALRAGPDGHVRTMAALQKLATRLLANKKVLAKSDLGKAFTYLLNQWKPLSAHLRFGETRLDNNQMENAIRGTAIGKKNWLFVGHPEAGKRSAVLYSLIVSCLRHGKDPHLYLRDVLTRLPLMTNQDDLAPLLPKNWQPAG